MRARPMALGAPTRSFRTHRDTMPAAATLWKHRVQLIAGFSTFQVAIQGVTCLCGFLLLRVLNKQEFAAYVIATSLLSMLNVLTDCGLGTGLISIGGRIWRDRNALSRLVATTLSFRARLAIGAIP